MKNFVSSIKEYLSRELDGNYARLFLMRYGIGFERPHAYPEMVDAFGVGRERLRQNIVSCFDVLKENPRGITELIEPELNRIAALCPITVNFLDDQLLPGYKLELLYDLFEISSMKKMPFTAHGKIKGSRKAFSVLTPAGMDFSKETAKLIKHEIGRDFGRDGVCSISNLSGRIGVKPQLIESFIYERGGADSINDDVYVPRNHKRKALPVVLDKIFAVTKVATIDDIMNGLARARKAENDAEKIVATKPMLIGAIREIEGYSVSDDGIVRTKNLKGSSVLKPSENLVYEYLKNQKKPVPRKEIIDAVEGDLGGKAPRFQLLNVFYLSPIVKRMASGYVLVGQ
jgi:hypothetical protein